MKKERVFIGMSGGVDSSVSALLLKEAGFDVTGVFIQGWYPDFLECNWKDDKRDAMRVAAKLDIPFITIDAEEAYKTEVVDYMIREYSRGRTPNPDVMCNRHVKFGVFFEEALKRGADWIATGHYAQIDHAEEGTTLRAAEDSDKDQTYFLWNVPKQALSKTLFPIGHLKKSEVREIARENELITADKKDSQGICFLGKVSMKDFLRHYIETKPGDVLDSEGEVIGTHSGALLYTLGERRGFTITKKGTNDAPRFVIAKDLENNTITVSEKESEGFQDFSKKRIVLENANWLGREPISGERYSVRFRHRQPLREATLEKETLRGGSEAWTVLFAEGEAAVSPGQSLVVYRESECLGGGIIQ
jgi:tRNA-specific 2-thiouridylase